MNRKSIIKIALSVAMLFFVLHFVDIQKLRHGVALVPLWLVIAVFIFYSLGQAISAYKWYLLMRAAGISAKFPRALSAYFIGMYVNCFGLGTIGGDLVRGLLVADDNSQRHISLASVISDRALGLGVLAAIGMAAAAFFGAQSLRPEFLYIGAGFIALVVLVWFFGPKLLARVLKNHPNLAHKVDEMLLAFPRKPSQLVWICFVSSLFHLSQIALHGLIAYGIGASIPFTYLCLAVPFANIISTLPISWMGLGVRENLYFAFFVPMYLTAEQAVILGALWLLGSTLASAFGGITAVINGDIKLLAERKSLRAQAKEAEATPLINGSSKTDF